MTEQERHAEVHRLKAEHGYGARRIGQELGISRHAATRLLAQPRPQPVAAAAPVQVAEVADQRPPVAVGSQPVAEERLPAAGVAAGVAVPAESSGHVAGVARLFRMPGARSPWLQVDLSGRPWLVRDLMRLARIGLQIPYVVDIAVRSFAAAYHQAVTRGDLVPGQAYEVQTRVRPCSHAA
ncbi:hypothetical protein [Streptomyces adelaidensis]|uniref:hypothetical protein n=1 Tax=Streptomyces adelaidensis TaxID=2796465 RepID=UPI00190327BC|nr:hypothetical protein [Streptomyces adelaidensis]